MEDNKNNTFEENSELENNSEEPSSNDEKKGVDLSNQFDKLFSSLNLSRRKEKSDLNLEQESKLGEEKQYISEISDDYSENELEGIFSSEELEESPLSENAEINVEDSEIDVESIKNSLEYISSETSFDIVSEDNEDKIVDEKPLFESIDTQNSFEVEPEKPEKPSSYENILAPDLKEQVEQLKSEGYEGKSFNYSEDVNAKTIPTVEKEIPTLEDGKIDYNYVVGENDLMNIESIYSCNDLIQQMSETVFMIEVYAKTLPDNLPLDVKRQSVLNIIKASSIEIDDLLTDAYKRIDVLNEVLEDVSQKSDDLDVENKDEITALERKIQELKLKMQKRTQYKQSQNAMIGYEIQRIVNIVEFIDPE